jgi:hypothetical protein
MSTVSMKMKNEGWRGAWRNNNNPNHSSDIQATITTLNMMLWKNLAKIPIQHPLAFGVGVSTVKTSASDLLVQTVVEQRQLSEIDWKRNAAFATFGCFYLGGVQYAIYVPLVSCASTEVMLIAFAASNETYLLVCSIVWTIVSKRCCFRSKASPRKNERYKGDRGSVWPGVS